MTRTALLAVLLLAAQTALVVGIGRTTSPVLDELPHLASGLAHWEFGTFDLYRVNPPLVRMLAALPVLAAGVETDWMGGWPDDPFGRPEFPLGRRLGAANGERTFWLFTVARWGCLPFVWLGGWVCFQWARELYGDAAGLMALAAWCVCPNVLAWGATNCPDLPAAATGLWATYAFWRWLRAMDWPAAAHAALSLGIALLTKSTWIVLLGLWPLLAAVWWWSSGRRQPAEETAARALTTKVLSLVGLLTAALYVVNVGYGFAGLLRPLGEFTFISRALTGHAELGEPGNRFRETWLAYLPSPLPADYLRGIDVQRYDFEKQKWSFLRGEQRLGGWWWYYLYALGVKTPLGTLALAGAALLTAGQRRGNARARDEFVLLAPAVVVLLLVSSQTGFNRYLRYALPAVPFVFVWMSRLAAPRRVRTELDSASCLGPGDTRRLTGSPWGMALAATCVAASAYSSLRVWPHSLAYFHELAGGPEQGHRHLLDANVDWGQGLLALRDWLRSHPEASPLFLTDFGWVEPGLAGIESRPVPRLRFQADGQVIEGRLEDLVPGWYVIDTNHLQGYRHYDSDRPVYTWLAEFTPLARPGYAHWVFHLSATDIAAFRARHSARTQ